MIIDPLTHHLSLSPKKKITKQFTQNQRKVKVSAGGKGDKKVKLEYSKVSVLVEKAPHGRGTAGSLREDWISVSARGPSDGVKSLVPGLRANCKTLSATEMPASSSSTGPFPTYIESGYAEFVSRMAARVKPPSIPMTKRKGRDVNDAATAAAVVDKEEDGVKESHKSKKQKKEKRNSGLGAAAGLAAGLAGVMKGAGAAVAAAVGMSKSKGGAGSSKAKEIQKTLDKINANLKGTAWAERRRDDSDSDDEPLLSLLPVKKKPGPKSKREKEEMAAKAARERGGKKATATTTADAPKKERKKPGPKSKKEKEEMAAKAAAEEAARAAKMARRADSSGTDKDSEAASDSDSDDMPLAAMV